MENKDKFKAVWVSHSSISDFLACPRAYYLRNVYKDPKTRRKITVMQPPLALGQIVHDVIDEISTLPVNERLEIPLKDRLEIHWKKVTGELGGFKSKEEDGYKNRGVEMLTKIQENPGPIIKKAVKINQELPNYWLSEEEEIILCGKFDWLEYIETDESIHIIDFKTGKYEEDSESLQLPIYYLLAVNTQNRKVSKISYWYLESENIPREQPLPDIEESNLKVLDIARRIKLARQIEHFKCPTNGCFKCNPLERVLKGEGKKVAVSNYSQDVYVLP